MPPVQRIEVYEKQAVQALLSSSDLSKRKGDIKETWMTARCCIMLQAIEGFFFPIPRLEKSGFQLTKIKVKLNPFSIGLTSGSG